MMRKMGNVHSLLNCLPRFTLLSSFATIFWIKKFALKFINLAMEKTD
jgi:hypothetical protein